MYGITIEPTRLFFLSVREQGWGHTNGIEHHRGDLAGEEHNGEQQHWAQLTG